MVSTVCKVYPHIITGVSVKSGT